MPTRRAPPASRAPIRTPPRPQRRLRNCLAGCLLGLCLAASLLPCSCATRYKPLAHRYGSTVCQVGNDLYEVSFFGNGNCSYERALDFAMLRAAELASSRQARSFSVLDVVNLSSARPYQTPTYFYDTASPYPAGSNQSMVGGAGLDHLGEWNYRVTEWSRKQVYYQPAVRLKVKLLPDPPGAHYPYEPAKEIERLKRKYKLNRTSTSAAAQSAS